MKGAANSPDQGNRFEARIRDRGGQLWNVDAFRRSTEKEWGPAINRAAHECGLSGGGTVLFGSPIDYRVTSAHPQISQWAIDASYDNLELKGVPGATVLLDVANVRGILMSGPAKAARVATGDIGNLNDYPLIQVAGGSSPTVYPLASTIAKGVASLTLATAADAGNFIPGDYILIRTGQLLNLANNGQPLGEINQVLTADDQTGVITLRWPPSHRYAQEYFIAGTTGLTSESVTANPALFGVSKITDRVLLNPRITNLRFEHGPAATSSSVNQRFLDGQGAINPRFTNLEADLRVTGFDSFGRHRGLRAKDLTFRLQEVPLTTGTAFATVFSGDTCCTDIKIDDLTILTDGHILYVHTHEGAALVRLRNLNLQAPRLTGSNFPWVNLAARAEDVMITDSLIRGGNGTTTAGINVDATCVGGLIDDCLIDTIDPTPAAVSILGQNWSWGSGNYLPQGSLHTTTALEDSVRILSTRVEDDNQTPVLGVLPRYVRVRGISVYVFQAFNSDSTDQITIGYDGDEDAFGLAVDVSTTGLKTVTLGAAAAYSNTRRELKAYYTPGGSQPTAGRALITLEYEHVSVG